MDLEVLIMDIVGRWLASPTGIYELHPREDYYKQMERMQELIDSHPHHHGHIGVVDVLTPCMLKARGVGLPIANEEEEAAAAF